MEIKTENSYQVQAVFNQLTNSLFFFFYMQNDMQLQLTCNARHKAKNKMKSTRKKEMSPRSPE